MARRKKITQLEVHDTLKDTVIRHMTGACSDEELQLELLSNTNGWLCHIDYCLSLLVDELQKGGKRNASDSEEVRGNDAG